MYKRKFAALFSLLFLFSASVFTACGEETKESASAKREVTVEEGFEEIYKGKSSISLAPNASSTIPVNADILGKNYLKIKLKTDVDLVGYIRYADNTGADNANVEKIFIEAGEKEFNTFLDAFRIGAYGNFDKKLIDITLQNVSETAGSVTLSSMQISDRTYDNGETLFIEDGMLKVGASLAMGGALTHVEKLNAGVVEYLDGNGDVRIEENVDESAVTVISDEVNFINLCDLGREVQQSYYADLDESNGYAPEGEILYDAELSYNPVQCGSAGSKQSQIIDYKITENEIWIKTKPLEWFFDNILSDSYMENRYYFNAQGLLTVYNRFVNFSQFKDMEQAPVTGHELPAIYVVHPLNYFYCETTEGTIDDPNLSPGPTSQSRLSLSHKVEGDYHYVLQENYVPDGWAAFVNDKNFGIGFYMPYADRYSASRGKTSIKYSENNFYHQFIHGDLGTEYVPSKYVSNYNYLTASVTMRMVDFVPVEYEYAVYVGNVSEIKAYFEALKEDGRLKNDNLRAWATK